VSVLQSVVKYALAPTTDLVPLYIDIDYAVVVAALGLAIHNCWRVATGVRASGAIPSWSMTAWLAAALCAVIPQVSDRVVPDGWQRIVVHGSADMPTLSVGDHVMADTRGGYAPRRGDVIVFESNNERLLRRVIGMPGETVGLAKGIVSINGQSAVLSNPRASQVLQDSRRFITVTQHDERLPGGSVHRIAIVSRDAPLESMADKAVPDGAYLVLGDNRDDSEDSRSAMIGFVRRSQIEGRLLTIFGADDGHRVLAPVP
jgi:signal peptidase I